MNRRTRTLVIGALPMVALSALITMPKIPGTDVHFLVPYAVEQPGPTFNTLGEVDGKEVIEIEGAKVDQTHGNLNMTTVAVTTGLTLPQAIADGLFSENTMVPIEQIFPQNVSPEEQEQMNTADFAASEAQATTAAMRYLNRPLQVAVAGVLKDGPAAGVLKEQDVLTSVDGRDTSSAREVKEAVTAHKPGEEITIGFKRGGQPQSAKVTLGTLPHGEADQAFLGITMEQVPADGVKVRYNLEDIGGPSAGLIFSLAVVDKLDARDITGGKFVAGTGTINDEGEVGPIGGITHKISAARAEGAEIFLAPAGNCAEVKAAAPEGITVAQVSTLAQAVDTLDAYQHGRDVQTCG